MGGGERARGFRVRRQVPQRAGIVRCGAAVGLAAPSWGVMQPECRARRRNGFVSAAAHALTALRLTLGPQ